jgi:hypothetical protein
MDILLKNWVIVFWMSFILLEKSWVRGDRQDYPVQLVGVIVKHFGERRRGWPFNAHKKSLTIIFTTQWEFCTSSSVGS